MFLSPPQELRTVNSILVPTLVHSPRVGPRDLDPLPPPFFRYLPETCQIRMESLHPFYNKYLRKNVPPPLSTVLLEFYRFL